MASSPKRPAPPPTVVHERPHLVEPVASAPAEFVSEPEATVEVVTPPSVMRGSSLRQGSRRPRRLSLRGRVRMRFYPERSRVVP